MAQPLIELDVSSVHEGLLGPEAVIRVSRRESHGHDDPDLAYRSWQMSLVFHCRSWQLEPLAVAFFSGARGQGLEIGSRTNLSSEGVPQDLLAVLSPSVRKTLLRAACRRDSVMHR